MRSPLTDVASTQSSELAHPSYFSNPALMDGNNLPSLNVDTNSLPTPTRGRRRRREPSPSPPLSHILPHINAHVLIHMLHTFYLPLPLPPPHDPPYFCALMNSLSIKKKLSIYTFARQKIFGNRRNLHYYDDDMASLKLAQYFCTISRAALFFSLW